MELKVRDTQKTLGGFNVREGAVNLILSIEGKIRDGGNGGTSRKGTS